MGVGETVFASPRESPADCSVRVFARRSTGRYMSAPSLITVVSSKRILTEGQKRGPRAKGKAQEKERGRGFRHQDGDDQAGRGQLLLKMKGFRCRNCKLKEVLLGSILHFLGGCCYPSR